MTQDLETDTFYRTMRDNRNKADDFGELPDLCIYMRLNTGNLKEYELVDDNKLDGALVVLITRGSITIQHNASSYTASGPSLVFLEPGATLSMGNVEFKEIEIHLLYYTRTFLRDLNLTLTALVNDDFVLNERPEIRLTEHELSQELRYIKIIRNVMDDGFNLTLNRHIISSLTSSFIYQNTLYMFKHQGMEMNGHMPSRRSTYVREFIRLVHLNYTRERSVAFYADRLCVSPKYLSILVKESTGRSAAAWIDHFVIMEAKNLLRFSGKNVQQVAYSLNFINQSAFGKYFKHLTGMSPTEYQRNG